MQKRRDAEKGTAELQEDQVKGQSIRKETEILVTE